MLATDEKILLQNYKTRQIYFQEAHEDSYKAVKHEA